MNNSSLAWIHGCISAISVDEERNTVLADSPCTVPYNTSSPCHVLFSLRRECRTVNVPEEQLLIQRSLSLLTQRKKDHSLALALTLTPTVNTKPFDYEPLLTTAVHYTVFNAPTKVTIHYDTT